MVLSVSSIKSDEVYPADYKIYNIGENLRLIYGTNEKYVRIVNRAHIPFLEKQDNTAWILAAAAEKNAGDISDWLEPNDAELMVLALSLYSDRNMEVRVGFTGSDQRFGTKKDTDIAITPDMSPWREPKVTIYSWGKTYVPNFKIKNPSEYKNLCMKLGVSGFRYQCEELAERPNVYDTIDLDMIAPGKAMM